MPSQETPIASALTPPTSSGLCEPETASGRHTPPSGECCTGSATRAAAKALAFWARCATARRQPGHCSRCGRPNATPPAHAGRRGICAECRGKARQYKADRLARRLAAGQEQLPDVASLLRRVRCLELRQGRFGKILRTQYKAGYQAGTRAERQRWRDMPRDWQSWDSPLSIEDRKQHSHRVAAACGA